MIDYIHVLDPTFFQDEDPISIARSLLGKFLISNLDNKSIVTRIVETEAYKAPEDKASHAFDNKKTKRTKTMFELGGISYIYLCYGLHQMFNIVTGPKDIPHAILIRAVEPIAGISFIKERRKVKSPLNYCNGPGKLCNALGINKNLNAFNVCDKEMPIWIGDNDMIDENKIIASPRVGVGYAEECAHWPFRFYIDGNPHVSLPRIVHY
ncbi:MAG: DNA-3-methyladenine glycosylase [Saprospiraceae bacterium]|nr:DNA-3-methyladenine glycosylase [Bacteroidia bacterium]NNE14077.1 DNA-3-methyladenine glycosylase [Saprospiraceae bacterium]NNL92295.1 DNA-3-methyladenine glycosylase [Saprospiraceae bacterium]